jgi:putative lysine transport system permease protein
MGGILRRLQIPRLCAGAGVTLLIAISGTLIGSAIGLIIGVVKSIPAHPNDSRLKTASLKITRTILNIYIEVFRGTPMIVQAMVIYYGLAKELQIYLPTMAAGIVVVSINTGAYMAEIVRGGIESIDKGQFEAAHAIGMTHGQTMLKIILPQAIRNILPATGNEFVINIKDTSVLNVISVTELFFASKSIAGTYMAYFETFTVTCVVYLVLTFTVTRILRALEKRMDGPSSYTIFGSSTMPDSTFTNKEGTAHGKPHP